MLKKILIDTSSNINIFYIDLLQKYFPSIYANMRRTTIIIKGFDDTKK